MYLGTKKIDKIEGNKVLFQDGTEEEYTHKQLAYLVTKKSKDATEVRNLVLENVMPEVKAAISGDDNMTITSEILRVLEEHNVTNAEFGNILQRILMDRLDEYNKLLKERMGDETEKYSKDIENLKEITKLLSDSYNRGIQVASGIAFGTYVSGKPAETCLDDIRMSNIAKRLKSI